MAKLPLLSIISRLGKRERVIFYVTAGIISLLVLDRTVVSQIWTRREQMDQKIKAQEELIRSSLIIATQEEKILKESKYYAPYFSEPESEEKEITAFLKEVENYAKDSSVYVVDIKPSGKKQRDASSTQYFLKMEFEALMDQLLHFFFVVENTHGLLKIEDYQIQPKTEGSSIVSCTLSISKTIIPP